ncbi:MAG: hypothetical protein E7385_00290 [Ruminococcaceae bacterium]|nr:hypothetical protein [Oscillospiraceae bacterium]
MKFKYVVKLRLGELSKGKNGWSKQANIIKWNNGLFKLDIRDWNNDKQQMRRGVTLTKSEAERLISLLKNIDMRLIDDYEIERTATVTMPIARTVPEWPQDDKSSTLINPTTGKEITKNAQEETSSAMSNTIDDAGEKIPIIEGEHELFTESA